MRSTRAGGGVVVAVPPGRPEVVAPRLARAVVAVLIFGFFGLIGLDVAGSARSVWAAVAGLAVLTAHAGLLVPIVLGGAVRRWRPLLGAQVVLTYLPLVLWPRVDTLWGLTAFLAGSCLVRLRPPYSWLCFAAVSVSAMPVAWRYEQWLHSQVYVLLSVASVGFLLYAMAWLRRLATDLPVAEARLAAIELARERRRLLNDAHDVLGFRLSALVLNIELARRGSAGNELAEARAQARAALAEARRLTAERAELSFADEYAAAGALLSAAGVELVAPGGSPAPPPEADLVLATVLREAVTNVVRHSTARHCSIALTVDRRAVHLVVSNDGAPEPPSPPEPGTGLASLAGRVTAQGGVLRTTARHGVFTLDVRVPAHRPARPATPFVPAGAVAVLGALVAVAVTSAERIDAPFLALMLACVACFVHLFRPRRSGALPPGWRLVLAAQVLLAYLPLLYYPADAWVLRHYVGGTILLLLRGRTRWLAAAGVLAAEVLLAACGVAPAASLVYHLAAEVDDSTAIFALVQLPLLSAALAQARTRLATKAVTRERLRFAGTLGGRLDERLRGVLHALAPDGRLPDERRLTTALELARAASADLRSVAAAGAWA